MTSDDRYIFSTIIEVDSKLCIIYIKSFTGEKAVAVKFTDSDYFDRLLRYNVNYHGDKVVTYIPSGRWGLLASDCQAVILIGATRRQAFKGRRYTEAYSLRYLRR